MLGVGCTACIFPVWQILAQYLVLVDDLDARLALSHKTGCRKIIIEVKSDKDRSTERELTECFQ